MAHTNSTTHYALPQFTTTDKPAWLTDVNNAYVAIDTGIYNAKKAGDDAQADATQALSDAGAAQATANGADAKASGAIASLSEAFIDSSTYDVGDLVIYNNLLYICHTAVTVPGAWTGVTNWSRTDIDTQLIRKLEDLKDVSISSPTQGQVLAFNSDGDIENKTLEESDITDLTADLAKKVRMLDKSNFTWTNATFTNEDPATRLFQINLDVSSTGFAYTKINVEFTTTGIKMAGFANGAWTTFWTL